MVPTGTAGKTTIINLLSRFYDVNEGSVKVDGYDVRDVTGIIALANGCHAVVILYFLGDDRGKYSLWKSGSNRRRNHRSCKNRFEPTRFIKELKDGYHTVVEERGSTLSGRGNTQLISFARALLADPRDIDSETKQLQALIQRLKSCCKKGFKTSEGRTSFIIAHRACQRSKIPTVFFYVAG